MILELFAGSRSVGRVAERFGHTVFSVDIKPFDGMSLVADVNEIDLNDIPFIPDVIWASPPCTTYSIAAISHHRNGTIPTSEFAKVSDKLLEKTLMLIRHFEQVNPQLKFFIENPVGMMRKMPMMRGLDRATVTYCKYGDTRMKPTDIWTNHKFSLFNPHGWRPAPKCFNGNEGCHHEAAPRGSRTGTQGLANDYERSRIPEALIAEIFGSLN